MSTEKWSSKEAAKAGQKFRREARNIFEEYQRGLFKRLEEARLIIKPRPRLIPRAVWMWLSDFFVDTTKINTAAMVESPSQYLTRKHHEAVAAERGTAPAQGDMDKEDDEWDESDEISDLLSPEERAKLSTE